MAIVQCSPCESCIGSNILNEKFKQDVELILCGILAAIETETTNGNVNLVGVNGVAPAVGNGITNTGTLRVTLSSDSTGTVALNAGANTIGKVDINPYATMGSGQTTVVTAGTQIQLAANTPIKSVTVKANFNNTGYIFVGAATVDSSTGFILSKNDSVSLDVDNLNDVWIDSSIDAQAVSYIYLV